MAQGLLIGIDGGGTHSTAVAAWPDGRMAAVAYGGGMNFHNVGVDTVRQRLEALVAELCEKAGAPAEKICVGMSALDAPADEKTLRQFAQGSLSMEQLDLQSDAFIALMGLTLGQPGVIVICGTGSMLLLVDGEGNQYPGGGWGYLLGDAGSGYTLARAGLMAATDFAEGVGEPTPLTEDAKAYFQADSLRGLIDVIYAPGFTPDRLAGFARCVISRAKAGDGVCCAILKENMTRLARLAAAMIAQHPEAARVGLYGGIFAHSEEARALFTEKLTALNPAVQVCAPEYPPELGAIIHLLSRKGCLSTDTLNMLKTTYEEMRK